jgi:hypothetical protein
MGSSVTVTRGTAAAYAPPAPRVPVHSARTFAVLTSPRALIESMSDDDHVFAGLGPEDESWYLRYRADWNSNNEALVAAYGIALTDSLALRFRAEVAAMLICAPAKERSHEYFKRIMSGECTI